MAEQKQRGRDAIRPDEIPKAGWKDIALRVKDEIETDHVAVVSAGVAFFGLLAAFPAIAALMSIAGLVLDPSTIETQLASITAALPEEAAAIVTEQAAEVAGNTGAGFAAAAGVLLSLYGAAKGMKTLMEGMNIAYDEDEDRGFIMKNLVALALMLLSIVGVVVALGFTVVVAALIGRLGLPEIVQTIILIGRWPVLGLLTMVGLAVLYRYGPSREEPEWRWVSVGAVVATVLWVLGSIGFSIYVANFGNYNETYGTLGGVIILLTWLWLSAFIVLLGAELNAEMEHQTARDTTTGHDEPRGERGAVKADTVGQAP